MPDSEEPKEPKNGGGERPSGAIPVFAANEKIEKINVADEIKNSFLDYSMSVIISRALPDVRDGLKPSATGISVSRCMTFRCSCQAAKRRKCAQDLRRYHAAIPSCPARRWP